MVFGIQNRAKYKVESGIRNYQPGNGGPTTTNSYTVKVPYYGEYKLIKYQETTMEFINKIKNEIMSIVTVKKVLMLITTIIIPLYVLIHFEDIYAPYSLAINGMILAKVILIIYIFHACFCLLNNYNKRDK